MFFFYLTLSLLFGESAFSQIPLKEKLQLKIVRFGELLPPGGEKLLCLFNSDKKFGYLFYRQQQEVFLEVINQGKSEGEKSRMRGIVKDYGSPFVLFLSFFRRDNEWGSHTEFLIHRRLDESTGQYSGNAMFTESFFEVVDGKEQERLIPRMKKAISCKPLE